MVVAYARSKAFDMIRVQESFREGKIHVTIQLLLNCKPINRPKNYLKSWLQDHINDVNHCFTSFDISFDNFCFNSIWRDDENSVLLDLDFQDYAFH